MLKAIVKSWTESDNVLPQEIPSLIQSIDLIGGSELENITNYGRLYVNEASAPKPSDMLSESSIEVLDITSLDA